MKNTANVVKTFAVRFFDIYFVCYAVLVVLHLMSDKSYIGVLSVGLFFAVLNCFLKYKLRTNNFYRNIGMKYGVCIFVMLFTYVILCIMGSKDMFNAFIFVFSALSLIGIYDTNLNLVSYIKSISRNERKDCVCIVKERDLKSELSVLSTSYKEWQLNEVNGDMVAEMLVEFLTISNENPMGHIVVRSMTSCDENGTEKLCVKSKEGYHIILRGSFENIVDKCSEIISEGKLISVNDEEKDKLLEQYKTLSNSAADVLCCAFKEVNNISEDETDDFIFAGFGAFSFIKTDADVVAEVKNTEYIQKIFGDKVFVSAETLEQTIEKLHKEGKYVCGNYGECDGEKEPKVKKVLLSVPENSHTAVNHIYTVLIGVLLLSANLVLSLFNEEIFSFIHFISAGIMTFACLTLTLLIGDEKQVNDKRKYITIIINTLGVVVSYFLGRYIMTNGDYLNDLFYRTTAVSMATITAVVSIKLYCSYVVSFNSTKQRISDAAMWIVIILLYYMPFSGKLLCGYIISPVYISVAVNTALICLFVNLGILNIISRRKNGRKISD